MAASNLDILRGIQSNVQRPVRLVDLKGKSRPQGNPPPAPSQHVHEPIEAGQRAAARATRQPTHPMIAGPSRALGVERPTAPDDGVDFSPDIPSYQRDAEDPRDTGPDDKDPAAVDDSSDIASDPLVHAEDKDDPKRTGPEVQEAPDDEQFHELTTL